MSKIARFKEAAAPLPEAYHAWQIFGSGMENVGRNGAPSRLPLRPPADKEVLVRIDALGICLSDIKVINQGNEHPRLRGRDLAADPTILGHECAVTVVAAGAARQGSFKAGERYIVQADIYYQGENLAFGYQIPGGMGEYAYLDERALDGDEGCYLLPVREDTGYSQAALAEPWACVEMSYNVTQRIRPQGNRMLIVSAAPERWHDDYPAAEISDIGLEELAEGALFDDIVLTEVRPDLVERLSKRLDRGGVLFLAGAPQYDGTASLDVGRIHYQGQRYFGGGATLEAIAAGHERNDLLAGGRALMIGAGGPMGQMHVQRAIELPGGPALLVAADLSRERMDHIEARFGALAKRKGITLVTLAQSDFADATAMNAEISRIAEEGRFDDIVLMAPAPGLAASVLRWAADGAFVNIFAGVPIGSEADFHLHDLCRGITLMGTSGSRIRDLRRILELVESGQLDTNLSVAAIGGLKAAREGLQAVKEARFPGKTVIYPQIMDLPLTAVADIPEQLPELRDLLAPGGAWTVAAERALLEARLP